MWINNYKRKNTAERLYAIQTALRFLPLASWAQLDQLLRFAVLTTNVSAAIIPNSKFKINP